MPGGREPAVIGSPRTATANAGTGDGMPVGFLLLDLSPSTILHYLVSVWGCQRGRFELEDHSLTLSWGAHKSRFSAFTVPNFTVNVDLGDASYRVRYNHFPRALGYG